ncbi:MAG: hypothetical protein QOG22_3435, partial [Pseudonocardiales bacterium]|nr:hypothetical protein [Pseudonocardiales bacterium]
MRPAGLVLVCNDIVQRGRTRIVECGSGPTPPDTACAGRPPSALSHRLTRTATVVLDDVNRPGEGEVLTG